MREKTRRERYNDKKRNAKTYPIRLCCVNFSMTVTWGILSGAQLALVRSVFML